MTARDLAGRRGVVLGLGLFGGGLGAARHLLARGADVVVTDLRDAETLRAPAAALEGTGARLVLGEHREEDLRGADLVVPNPAVRPDSPWLALARETGARVATDVELFLEASPARAAVVTGTQGKSSTATFLVQLLDAAGERAHLAGNVGRSPLELLPALGPEDVVVLELSSYQLEHLGDPRGLAGAAEVAAVTNVRSDHLERHGTQEAYAAAKRRALELLGQGGAALLPSRDAAVRAWAPPGATAVPFDAAGDPAARLVLAEWRFALDGEPLGRASDLRAPGAFQAENALVALGAARLLGADAAALGRSVGALAGPPHRLEDLGEVDGRRVWDNGVSTTPDSTASALTSLPEGCTLLCGGQAKALPYEDLARLAAARGARVVTFGAAAEALARTIRAAGAEARVEEDLAAAVGAALARTPRGGQLLFSPACASFDAFPNFRARAQAFRAALPTTPPGADPCPR